MRELLDARDALRAPGASVPERAGAKATISTYSDQAAERCKKLREQVRQTEGLADQLRREASD
jgi:hypothetical protein